MNIVSLTFKCISIFLLFCVRCCIFFCILSFLSSQFSLFIFCKNNCRDKKRKLFFSLSGMIQYFIIFVFLFKFVIVIIVLFFLPHLKHFGRIYFFFRKYTNVMSIQNKLSPDLFVVVFKMRYCIYFYYCLKMVYLYSVFILYRHICHVVADCSRLPLSLSNCYTEAVVGCKKLIYFPDILNDSIFYI